MNKSKETIQAELTWDRLDLVFESSNQANLETEDIRLDYKFYQERCVDEETLDNAVTKFIEYASDTYIAFLWQSAKGFKEQVHSMFIKTVYKREIKLTFTGAFNLLNELYKLENWTGNKANNYKGIQRKLVKCFPDFDEFTIVVFQADNLEEVRKLKKEIRRIYNINFSSMHSTDNSEEALKISRLLLSKSGRHFLNYSNPDEFEFLGDKIEIIKKFISEKQIDPKDIILGSDMTLALYGIKDLKDINYLSIQDPYNCLYYCDMRFISFEKAYEIKSKSNEEKDKEDIKLMNSLINHTAVDYKTTRLNHRITYMKIKLKLMIINLMKVILKKIGLFIIARVAYRKMTGREIE